MKKISLFTALVVMVAGNAFAGGTIKGTVTFNGTPPAAFKMPVAKNADYCGKEVQLPLLLVNPQNKGVEFTVIHVEGAKGTPSASNPGKGLLRMGAPERKCDFIDHVMVMQKNQDMTMRNQDPVLHNPHPFTEKHATLFNVALTEKGQEMTKKVRNGGFMRLQCDSHVHMNGWVIAFEHPYYAVTDANGSFTIADVPAGKYKLAAWHESWTIKNKSEVEASIKASEGKGEDAQLERPSFGEPVSQSQDIEVKDGGTVEVKFEIKG